MRDIERERARAIGKTCNLVGILYNRKMWRHIIYGVQRLTVETDSIDFEWPIKNCTFLIPHRMVFRSMIQFNVNPYTNIKVWNWGVFGSYLSGWWDWSLAIHTHTHTFRPKRFKEVKRQRDEQAQVLFTSSEANFSVINHNDAIEHFLGYVELNGHKVNVCEWLKH